MTRGEHGELREDARDQVRIAPDSAVRLQRLVDQLLDAARAEAGELKLERVPGDLGVSSPSWLKRSRRSPSASASRSSADSLSAR